MMASVFCVRADWRSRWRTWLGIALLIGAFGGLATAAAAAARRSETAYERLTASHDAADAIIENGVPNPDVTVVTHNQVASLPGVAEAEAVRSYPESTAWVWV